MIKKAILSLIVMILAVTVFAQVNGELQQLNDKWILRTWGTHAQRGYAHGYLLADPIMDIFNNYFYQYVCMGNATVYNNFLNFFLTHFQVDTVYQQEAQGIVNGLLASGADTFITGLSRDVMMEDVLLTNALVDMNYYRTEVTGDTSLQLGCASLSNWGNATQADTLLNGHSVIYRFMDWNQDGDLIANPLLMISFPSEADEQPWVSFTYPGMMGALSAISLSGKCAFLNVGNVHSYNDLNNLNPILLSIRNGIEKADYNEDGLDNLTDIFDSIFDDTSLSGTIIHALSETGTIHAGIIETNNVNGTVMRTVGINSGLPGDNLAATNHFRMLASPVCCTRYSNIQDSLYTNSIVPPKRQVRVLNGAAGQDNNMMAIQYIPLTGKILWSTASLTQPAFQREMMGFYLDELLDTGTPNQDEHITPANPYLTIFPNPLRRGKSVTIRTSGAANSELSVYNLKGQKICSLPVVKGESRWNGLDEHGNPAAAGLYLLRNTTDSGNLQTGKVLIIN